MSGNETANDFSKVQDESEVSSNEAAAAGGKAAKPQTSQVSDERSVGSECTANVTNASHTSTKASAPPCETKNPSPEPREALKKEPAKADLLSMPSSMLSKSAVAVAPVSSIVSSSSAPMPSAPKIIVSTAAVRSSTPLMVGARVLPSVTTPAVTSVQGLGALAAHPGGVAVTPNQTGGPTMTPPPVQGAIMAFPRTSTPQQTGPVARGPQTTSIQLPANFHIPQGMVLIRSDSGQLMLVSQQALAQVQAQGLVPRQPGVTTVRPQSSQAAATATSIIRVSIPPSSTNVATILNPAPTTGTAVLKPTSTPGTTIIKATSMPGSTIIKPTTVLGTTGLKPSSTTVTTAIKPTAAHKLPNSTSSGSINQSTMSGTTVTSTSVVKAIGKASLSPSVTQIIRPGGTAPRNISPNIPTRHSTTKSCVPIPVTAETLENVKKCKNFLDLLDGQLEAEEFTEKLYMELKSSPQPYLVPFLKRSLPALSASQEKSASETLSTGDPAVKRNDCQHPVTTSSCVDAPVQKPKPLIIQTNTQPGGALGMQYSLRHLKPPLLCHLQQCAHTASRTAPQALSGSSLGVIEVSPDVLGLLSHATQERLRGLLEKLTAIAQHRSISYRDDWRHIQTNDTRSQLKFLEQLEKVEKRRREEEERETLLRIAKTRSSSGDPEQLRLKQRAKEMQQLEQAQMQHREANLAALAALGPRKRKPLEASGLGANQVLGSYVQRTGQRVPTRVTFRDLIFCMEQDLTLRHSLILYNAFLR
ncbi:hypothetical protein MHYP_G00056330 [Metynnis hypsauchen]